MKVNPQSLRGLSAEQVLLIADELCLRFPDKIRDFAALSAVAATTTARLHGFPIHHDPESQAQSAYNAVISLQPLVSRNDILAATIKRTLLALNTDYSRWSTFEILLKSHLHTCPVANFATSLINKSPFSHYSPHLPHECPQTLMLNLRVETL